MADCRPTPSAGADPEGTLSVLYTGHSGGVGARAEPTHVRHQREAFLSRAQSFHFFLRRTGREALSVRWTVWRVLAALAPIRANASLVKWQQGD